MTTSKAKTLKPDAPICQGDIFRNIKYNYIEAEDEEGLNIVELDFPYAIIVSQACDTVAMDQLQRDKRGKATKFMPSVLLCPIYEKNTVQFGEHISDVLSALGIEPIRDNVYQKEDIQVAGRDWHYRFHNLNISVDEKTVLENLIIDFKHSFSVPMIYLQNNINNRMFSLEILFAEQITLKFATYLTRVAIP